MPESKPPIRFAEFVTLVAALMAVGALGVDSMLPALPEMGRDLGAAGVNAPPLVISVYLIGFGMGQIVHGSLSDRFGRKPVLASVLLVYGIGSAVMAGLHSFAAMLVLRFVAGLVISGTRVVTTAFVRDCFAGRAMARVMSLAAMVFLIVPVLAPTFGQFLLLFGSWRLIFSVNAGFALLVLGWLWLRFDETLAPAQRLPLSVRRVAGAFRVALTNRASLGYMLALAALQGALYGYINSVEPIVSVVFHRPWTLNLVFAGTAGAMAMGNFLTSRAVMRLGSRLLSHSALCLLIVFSLIALGIHGAGAETLIVFAVVQALTMACSSIAASNFSAMAMEEMGAIAGAASSVQGFVSQTLGALIGMAIGQSFAGTTVPLHAGYAIGGLAALAIIAATEHGRLFRPHPSRR